MNYNKKLKEYLFATLFAIIAIVAVAWIRGAFSSDDIKTLCMGIGDGLFVAGVLYAGVGLLIKISTTGQFDIFGYGIRSLKYLFTPTKKNRDEGGYYEYTLKRKERRRPAPMYLVWIGVVLIALAAIFNFLSI